MGRTRVKNKKTSSTSAADKEEHSVEALFKKAQSLIVQCNYELAQKFAHLVQYKDRMAWKVEPR